MDCLDEIYPRVTKSMLFLYGVPALALLGEAVWLALMAPPRYGMVGAALFGVMLLVAGFVRHVQHRCWVRERAIGYNRGVLYLCDGVKNEERLRREVGRLCRRDVLAEVSSALQRALVFSLKRPSLVLAITKAELGSEVTTPPVEWRFLGFSLGMRIWIVWRHQYTDVNAVNLFRVQLGQELGEAVLSASGLSDVGTVYRNRVIRSAGLDKLLTRPAIRESGR